jgi:hypothetical protein
MVTLSVPRRSDLAGPPEQRLKRLKAVGLSKPAADAIRSLFLLWVDTMGPEEAVRRFKALKVDFLRFAVGLPPAPKDFWVSYRDYRGRKVPKGPLSYLWKIAATEPPGSRKFVTAWNAMMLYTSVELRPGRITQRQWRKFSASFEKEPTLRAGFTGPVVPICNDGIPSSWLRVQDPEGMPPPWRRPRPIASYAARPNKRGPTRFGSRPEAEAVLGSMDFFREENLALVQRHWGVFSHVLRGWSEWAVTGPDPELRTPGEVVSGHIGCIQEPGMKARFVAVPLVPFQLALEPLGDFLFSKLRDVKQDYCFDQAAGLARVAKALKSGAVCHSIDLQDASNHTPWRAIEWVMGFMQIPAGQISLLHAISSGRWLTEYSPSGAMVCKTGVPLGLYPCFAAFSLLLHAIIRSCIVSTAREEGVRLEEDANGLVVIPREREDVYALLGDDLVVFDDRVAKKVRMVFASLDIAISEEKSIVSSRVAEFAGKAVFADGPIHGFKYRVFNDNAAYDLVRAYGYRRAMALISPQMRTLVDEFIGLPSPYGLEINPKGVPLRERQRQYEFLVRQERISLYADAEPMATSLTRHLYQAASGGHSVPDPDMGLGNSDQELLAGLRVLYPGWSRHEYQLVANAIWRDEYPTMTGLPLTAEQREAVSVVRRRYTRRIKAQYEVRLSDWLRHLKALGSYADAVLVRH